MPKLSSLLYAAVLLTLAPWAAHGQELELHFINVGQGDSTLIVCPNGDRVLVDLGSVGGLNNQKKKAVAKYIKDRLADPSNPRLDVLVITHPDRDHYNLIEKSLGDVEVGQVIIGGSIGQYTVGNFNSDFLQDFQSAGTLVSPPASTSDPEGTPSLLFECGPAVNIWILAANVPAGPGAPDNFVTNTPSIVLRVAHGDFETILTGDATFTTEQHILGEYSADFLEVDILKLGHHGSRATSTSRGQHRLTQDGVFQRGVQERLRSPVLGCLLPGGSVHR